MTTAIETLYKGYRFRSRLEARWAVFFDALDLQWLYEPQGYDVGGERYLPDFWVDGLGWIEVKGELDRAGLLKLGLAAGPSGLPFGPLDSDIRPAEVPPENRYWELPVAQPVPRLAMLGDVPDPDNPYGWVHPMLALAGAGHIVWRCAVPFGRPLRWYGVGDWTAIAADPDQDMLPHGRTNSMVRSTYALKRAYGAARSARFEHGESGAGA